MRSRSSVAATPYLAVVALGCILCQFLAGSVALGQPFPSFMLDTTIVHGPTMAEEVAGTAVAFGPDTGLVVWVEDGGLLRGARVSGAGVLLDTVPIDLNGPDYEVDPYVRPGVAWGAGRFLVTWVDEPYALCAWVGTDGNVIGRAVLQDMLEPIEDSRAAADFDGTNFTAAWAGSAEGSQYTGFFCRVTPEGAVLDSPPKAMAPLNELEQYDVAVRFHDDRYLAVWHDDLAGMWGSFILPDGSILDSVGFPIRTGTRVSFPHLTHDSRNFVASWRETGDRLMLARITDSGQVLDTARVFLDTFARFQNDIFSVGDTTLVVFSSDSLWDYDSTRVFAVRVDTALNRLDSAPVALWGPSDASLEENAPNDPAIALCGGNYFVAWVQPFVHDSSLGTRVTWYRRLNRQGQPVDSAPVLASYGSSSQTYPDVATDGANFLAVWLDTRRDSTGLIRAVCGTRFSAAGSVLDPRPVQIGVGYARRVAAAYGGGCYLVVWSRGLDYLAARVAPDGTLLDSVPFVITDPDMPAWYPDVAYGDSVFLVVWSTSLTDDIHGVRITPTGQSPDTVPLVLQVDTGFESMYPQVAFDGVNFLVARNDNDPNPRRFRGVRVSPGGQLLDTADIDIDTATASSVVPRLAFGGGVYLATNSRYGNSCRVSPGGEVLGPVPSTYHNYAQVVFDGTDFMLLCERESSDQLGAMRITPDGRLLDSVPFLLVEVEGTTPSVRYAAMAANDAGHVGLVSRCFEQAPYQAYRIRAAAFPAVLGIESGREAAQARRLRALPNPASKGVNVSFSLRKAGPVLLEAFNPAGRRCAVIRSGAMAAGAHELSFDTRRLANGVYFLRLAADADTRSTRLVVAR